MSKAVDIFSGILFVRTRHYDDVKKVVVLQGNKPERRFFEERLQGKWIQYRNGHYTGVKCSLCDTIMDFTTNYCPNCGADMRGNNNGKETTI